MQHCDPARPATLVGSGPRRRPLGVHAHCPARRLRSSIPPRQHGSCSRAGTSLPTTPYWSVTPSIPSADVGRTGGRSAASLLDGRCGASDAPVPGRRGYAPACATPRRSVGGWRAVVNGAAQDSSTRLLRPRAERTRTGNHPPGGRVGPLDLHARSRGGRNSERTDESSIAKPCSRV